MKTKKILWAVLSMAAALVMTACSSDNDVTETPSTPSTPTTKTIPYTVTVTDGSTRATVDADYKTLRFAAGDKLYITGTNIQGVLNLQAGDEGKTSDATFSGDLTYLGSGSPAADHPLTATLVSAQQTVGTQVSVDGAGAVTVNYPTTAYCTSVNDAVQQYSRLTGTSTYGARAFSLTQQTAFLNFVITFEDGTTSDKNFSTVVNNGGSAICSAIVTTTTEDEKVVAKFVLPVAVGTTLSSASVKMGSKASISFGDSQTLTGKVYNVKRTRDTADPQLCPDEYHPHMIDLGLPSGTKWACCNVGATSPEQVGNYYAWGETAPHDNLIYDLKSYKYNTGDGETFQLTKYCYDATCGYNGFTDRDLVEDQMITLDDSDDAAYVNWGPSWCMPTTVQFFELVFDNNYYTDRTTITVNGVNGNLFTSRFNGNSIFFPATGFRWYDGNVSLRSPEAGFYWTSTLYDPRNSSYKNTTKAWYEQFGYGQEFSSERQYGYPVRPVRKN